MRILEVTGTLAPSYGGPSAFIPELCRALAQRGHAVELFATDPGGPDEDAVNAAAPPEVEITRFPVRWPRSYGTSWPMARALRRHLQRFDVVHVHSIYGFHTLATATLCRRLGVPYVVSAHGALDPFNWERKRWKKAPYERLLERRNLEGASALVFASPQEQFGASRLGLRPPGRVVPLAVTPPSWCATERRERRDNVAPTVVFIGRMVPVKRLDLLVDAFRLVADVEHDARLVIVGPETPTVGKQVRSHVHTLGLADRVTFAGPVYGDWKWRVLAGASVFAMPSDNESFGLAVVEAMAAGVPVVVSDAVPTGNLIAAAGAGRVAERNPEALARAILSVVTDERHAQEIGLRAAALARDQYSWERVTPLMEEVLTTAAAGR